MPTICECVLTFVVATTGRDLELRQSPAQDTSTMLVRVRQELLALEGPASSLAEVVQRLLLLGKGCERPMLEVLEAGTIAGADQPPQPLVPDQEEALLLALAAQPADLVRRMVSDRAAAATTDARARVVLVQVLGCMGSRQDLPLLFSLGSSIATTQVTEPAGDGSEGGTEEPASSEPTTDAVTLERAFTAILARDPGAFAGLEGRLRSVEKGLLPPLLRGIGESRRSEGVLVLANMLGRHPESDAVALEEIARLARVNRPPFDPYAVQNVRRYLEVNDAELRRAAAEAAGWLADDEAASKLVEMLETDTQIVRGSALEALRMLSGYSYPAEASRWRAWLRSEEEWWNDRADGVFEDLESRKLSVVVAALREVCSKRFRRADLAERLAPLLLDGDSMVRKLACQALVQLDTLAAIPALIDRLEDAEPDVRHTAWEGLKRITKLDLPPAPESWRQALAGQTISRSSR
jgi:hypothetical protein